MPQLPPVRLTVPRKAERTSALPAAVLAERLRRLIGAFDQRLRPRLDGRDAALSRPARRLLADLAQTRGKLARDAARELDIDPGQLSRLVARLEAEGLLVRLPPKSDGRQSPLAITPSGRAALRRAERAIDEAVDELLQGVAADRRRELAAAMQMVEGLLVEEKP